MRSPLPHRRHSETFAFVHGKIKYFATIGFDREWNAKEIFLVGGKAGTEVEAIARDSSVAASLALQYGVPLNVLRSAMTRLDGPDAAGPLGHALDLVAGVQS